MYPSLTLAPTMSCIHLVYVQQLCNFLVEVLIMLTNCTCRSGWSQLKITVEPKEDDYVQDTIAEVVN